MNYLINNTVVFDVESALLWLANSPQNTCALPKPACRLLFQLIIAHNSVVSRAHLLKTVWEDHGLTPSGSNLSNHISILRKTFVSLGITDEIIITVPKEGFRLNAEVVTQPAQKPLSPRAESLISSSSTVPERQKPTIALWLFFLLFILLAGVSWYQYRNALPDTAGEEIVRVGACYLVDLGQSDTQQVPVDQRKVMTFMSAQGIHCQKDNNVIFYQITSMRHHLTRVDEVLFVSQCPRLRPDSRSHCRNYFYFRSPAS
ncbi:winged helix-turn-helix domain-containing protein [Pantoea sp. 1.19]|uniref:winged helix-turn-helix domain-containing protein n=1 Tax=Pantoea sp. 1.19 TaxID=1925589 RepID=UPI000948F2C5|nr:winged helix-turn-helix domain-containing protein [Pantoea sp. 1.19]